MKTKAVQEVAEEKKTEGQEILEQMAKLVRRMDQMDQRSKAARGGKPDKRQRDQTQKPKWKQDLTCYYCGGRGHFQSECRKKAQAELEKTQKSAENSSEQNKTSGAQ